MAKTSIGGGPYDSVAAAEQAHASSHFVLRLYVTGSTLQSTRAIVNIRKVCEDHLDGRYELEVVDLSQYPLRARDEQIFAAPTLIKELPLPLRRFIGDMSQTDGLLFGLGLRETSSATPEVKSD